MVRRYDPKRGELFATFIQAHGAGAGQNHPWMVTLAGELAAQGVRVFTFDFPYMQEGRKVPDPPARLQSSFRRVIARVRAELEGKVGALFIGGKSLGGRMASHVVAEGEEGIMGLICLGYPLHPPGKAERLRVDHWPRIFVPTLIVQGSKDNLGTPEELRGHLASIPAPTTLHVIEEGDHSFKLPKSLAPDPDATLVHVAKVVSDWMDKCKKASKW